MGVGKRSILSLENRKVFHPIKETKDFYGV
jgi:hypothetical protein